MILFDLSLYALLLVFFIISTRVKSSARINLAINGQALPGPILQCNNQLNTRVGLLNTPVLPVGAGVLLVGTKSIHTLGMPFNIDVIFLSENLTVLDWKPDVETGRNKISGPKGTRYILELGAGSIGQYLSQLKMHSKTEVTPWNQQ